MPLNEHATSIHPTTKVGASKRRAYFDSSLEVFLNTATDTIIGRLATNHAQDLVIQQTSAWRLEVDFIKQRLQSLREGWLFLEFAIPRTGQRADAILFHKGVVFIFEFKVGETRAHRHDLDQVEGYALDLHNFHEASHDLCIVPILIPTHCQQSYEIGKQRDNVFFPIVSNGDSLLAIVEELSRSHGSNSISADQWLQAPYRPTPTIIEAAQSLYAEHNVDDIARNDAGAKNLASTSDRLSDIVRWSHQNLRKSICFVTGVPGAGKTLAGLNIATSLPEGENAVFLSGNGPLVDVLREALARDESRRIKSVRKAEALRRTKAFVQNIHHFRDDALTNSVAPTEHVAVFDEAQRAWDRDAASKFMRTKRGQHDFDLSEPEFLIGVMDRHDDWCVVVALVGGGQELNTGEAGLIGWRDALSTRYRHWDVYFSDVIDHAEYSGGEVDFANLPNSVRQAEPDLHLSVSMRSFRAQSLSAAVHHLVNGRDDLVQEQYQRIADQYPIRVTRDLQAAREWIRTIRRGVDSSGILATSGAKRLRPEGIFVESQFDAPVWFLNPSNDVRSAGFLETVASEFDVQGLELDWTIVGWDADFRYGRLGFEHWKFAGTAWRYVNDPMSQVFLRNKYRVLLTRARQGMVIFVPNGDDRDGTRLTKYYDATYQYLIRCGIPPLELGDHTREGLIPPG